jgi:hypothetical protein
MKGYQWVMPQNDAGVIAALQSQPLFVSPARSIRLLMLIATLWICKPVGLHTIRLTGMHHNLRTHGINTLDADCCRSRARVPELRR